MRVLQVVTSLLPGGAEKLIVDMSEVMIHQGADVEVAVFNGRGTMLSRRLTDMGVKIHILGSEHESAFSVNHYVRLRSLLRRGAYDVAHSHNTACQLFLAACPKYGALKFVTTEHNVTNRRRGRRILSLADKMMYGRYDRVACISDGVKQALCDFVGGDLHAKCEVIHNGVDLSLYSSSGHAIAPGEGDVVVTMVAGFREQKDHETAVRALLLLPSRVKLRFVGDGVTVPRIRRLVSDLGLGERVDFMGFRDDVPRILAESDIALLSSHYEGEPLTAIEGMASGLPMVASDVPGLRETMAGRGMLFRESSPRSLAEAIETLITRPEVYAETASQGLSYAAGFSVENTARMYLQLYHSLFK